MEEKNKIILIVEDDEALGTAISEFVTRLGWQAFVSLKPEAAYDILGSHKVDLVLCDCLLPQMTGDDFVVQAKSRYPNQKFKVVMMSGIYTDKQFIKESTHKTKAVSFLQKPFELEALSKILTEQFKEKKDDSSTRRLLYQMFSNPNMTVRQKQKLIEGLEEVSGYDLPYIYSLLVETKSSGYLNIYHSNGIVSGVSFCKGNIVGVDIEDKTTYLGEMLIQSGYVLPGDVQAALREKNYRRLGSYLISENQLSPHAFDFILEQQMNIRLSRTISEEKIRINFAATDVEMISPFVDSELLMSFLHDWIASKISVSWLKSLYMMWSGYIIVPSLSFNKDNPALNATIFKSLEGFADKLKQRMSLNQLLKVPGYNEKAVYMALHFLLTRGLILFEKRISFASEEEQLVTLKALYADIEKLDPIKLHEYMGNSTLGNANPDVLTREFLTLLGDQPSNVNSEAYKLWNTIKNKVESAAANFSTIDSTAHNQIKENANKNDAEAKIKASRLMEEIKQALFMNQFTKAAELMNQVIQLKVYVQQLHLFNAWIKLGQFDSTKKAAQIKEIEIEMVQVAPDEKYDAIFPFVSGLLSKVRGDINGAKKSIEKSLIMDPGMIVARRELNNIEAQSKKQDILKMDLKDMVSDFFKKKA